MLSRINSMHHLLLSVVSFCVVLLVIPAALLSEPVRKLDRDAAELYQEYLQRLQNGVQLSAAEKAEFVDLQAQVLPDLDFTASLDNEGGPDSLYYSYRDNIAPDDVPYEWIELRDDPEAVWIGGYNDFTHIDDGYSREKLPIGFPFPFYDEVYDSLRVTTNGVILFTLTDMSWENGCMPFAPIPGPMIAAFWDDLGLVIENRPDTMCVGYKNFGDYFVLEYDHATRFEPLCRDTAVTFEAILYRSGDIKLQYRSITPQHFTCENSQSIGIQRHGERGSAALTYVCNGAGHQPMNGLAVLFYRASGVPVKVESLSAVLGEAGVELSWTDPQTDTRGTPLTIDNVQIWLGPVESGRLLGTVDPGVQSFMHSNPANGYTTYSVRAFADPYYADTCNVSLTIGPVSIYQDFEDNDGGWVPQGSWAWGTASYPLAPVAYSGEKLWGTSLTAAYPHNACWSLDLDPDLAVIAADAYVEFQSWHFTDAGYDGCNFEISIDDGESWSVLYPDSGSYDYSSLSSDNHCIGGQAAWSAYNLTRIWKYMRFPIGEYLEEMPIFRFKFGSDDSILGVGFFFDDFRVWGLGEPSNVSDHGFADAVPREYRLLQNFPNPFNSETSICFELPEQKLVNITIYNITGQEVARPVSDIFAAGLHQIPFDATGLSTGVYLVRMESANSCAVNKMLLLK